MVLATLVSIDHLHDVATILRTDRQLPSVMCGVISRLCVRLHS